MNTVLTIQSKKMSTELNRKIKIMELEKTQERLEFEATYYCYMYLTREENRYGYEIDSVVNTFDMSYDEIATISSNMKLRARFNAGTLKGIWLPREFGVLNIEWFENNKEILENTHLNFKHK